MAMETFSLHIPGFVLPSTPRTWPIWDPARPLCGCVVKRRLGMRRCRRPLSKLWCNAMNPGEAARLEIRSSYDRESPEASFRDLFSHRIPDWLLSRLEELGYGTPTLVQRKALEVIFEGKDALVHAQTGSGKTLAFLLPMFAALEPSRSAVQALVVVPTRELGLQVAGVAKRLAAATSSSTGGRVQVMSVLEGSRNKRQRVWAWADPPHIVIGNPDNLSHLVSTGAIRVNSVAYVVVDEVDASLLSADTRASLHDLLAKSLSPTHAEDDQGAGGEWSPIERRIRNRQTVFASATVPQHNHFIKQCVKRQWTLSQPVHVQVHPKETMPPSLSHYYVVCPADKKISVLRALVRREILGMGGRGGGRDGLGGGRALVFAPPSRSLEELAKVLDEGLQKGGGAGAGEPPPPTEVLREELGLNQRADAMSLFREGKTRVLLATDLAARGLDVPEVTHVFNLDLPSDGEGYVHRGGRAGRLGRRGKVVSIITPEQEFVVHRLANSVGVEIRRIESQGPSAVAAAVARKAKGSGIGAARNGGGVEEEG